MVFLHLYRIKLRKSNSFNNKTSMCSSYRFSYACITCILLTMFEGKITEARVVWVPHYKKPKQGTITTEIGWRQLRKNIQYGNFGPALWYRHLVFEIQPFIQILLNILCLQERHFRAKVSTSMTAAAWILHGYMGPGTVK